MKYGNLELLKMKSGTLMRNGVAVKVSENYLYKDADKCSDMTIEPDHKYVSSDVVYNMYRFDKLNENDVDWESDMIEVVQLNGERVRHFPYNDLVSLSELDIVRSIFELEHWELVELCDQVNRGSIYVEDYQNNLGVDVNEVFDYMDGYLFSLDDDDFGDAEGFANWVESR